MAEPTFTVAGTTKAYREYFHWKSDLAVSTDASTNREVIVHISPELSRSLRLVVGQSLTQGELEQRIEERCWALAGKIGMTTRKINRLRGK